MAEITYKITICQIWGKFMRTYYINREKALFFVLKLLGLSWSAEIYQFQFLNTVGNCIDQDRDYPGPSQTQNFKTQMPIYYLNFCPHIIFMYENF